MPVKKRIVFLDIIRIFACLCVLIIHFNASVSGYDIAGNFIYPNELIPNYWFGGVYLEHIGVGLFFIISGAGLWYSHQDIGLNFRSIFSFYKKRAKSLYPLFWVAFIVSSLFHFLYYQVYPLKKWYYLLVSLAGMDGYAMLILRKGYYFYQVGEWFLGCIICLYLLYPFLSRALQKAPVLTSLFVGVLYVGCMGRVSDFWFFMQLPYVLFGMLFMRNIGTALNWKVWFFAGVFILVRILFSSKLTPLTVSIFTCWILFLCFVLICELLEQKTDCFKNEWLLGRVSYFSFLTYPAFLVHHKLITVLAGRYNLTSFPYRYTVMLFIIYILGVYVLSVGLVKLTNYLRSVFAQAQAGLFKNGD